MSVVNSIMIDYDDVFDKALEVYTDLLNEKVWLTKKPKKSAFATKVNQDGNTNTTEDDSNAEGNEGSDTKKKKKKCKKKKKKNQGNGDDASQATAGTAAIAGTTPEECIHTFTMDGVQYKGNVSAPKQNQENLPRVFKHLDNNADIELFWCWKCGQQGGVWKCHTTRNCPFRWTSSPGQDTQDNWTARFQESAGLAQINPPVVHEI